MNPYRFVIIAAALIFCIYSCTPKPGVTPSPETVSAGDELFLKAENAYEAESYEEALDLYNDYLVKFPEKPLAPAALMKIGSIQILVNAYDQAIDAYERILAEYPDSPFARDASVEILVALYKMGRYEDVIVRASDTLETIDSSSRIFRTYTIVGDAYMALGAPVDAVEFYVQALKIAPEPDKGAVAVKLRQAIARLDSEDVASLLKRTDENLPMALILYQLGLNFTLEENYSEALEVLNEFQERFPDHPNIILVESLIDEIQKNALYNRYTIGCLLPLSGPYQTFGLRALKGIELALGRFSSQSLDPPMNIIVKDTGSSPEGTMQALRELNNEKVAAIIGPLVHVEATARSAQELGIPIMTITQKDEITDIGDKVFRNFITPEMQVQALASYAVEKLGVYRFAILYPNENYGRTFMDLFWDALLEYGGTVTAVETYNPEKTDFADPIKKIAGLYYEIPEDLKPEENVDEEALENENNEVKADGSQPEGKLDDPEEEEEPEAIIDFDAIFIPESPNIAGLIIPQLAFYDVKDVYLLGTNLWHSDVLLKIAGQYVQGAIMPDGFFAESSSPTSKNFVEMYRATYEEEPGFIEAVVYDSAMILFGVLGEPEIRFRSDIKNQLLTADGYQGVTGWTRFDENGDAVKELHLLRVKGRQFVELE